MTVGRAGALNEWQVPTGFIKDDILFLDENQRTDQRDFLAVKISHRHKGVDAAFVKQTEKKSFDHVIRVVSEGNFIAAQFFGKIMQGAAPHARTECARIFLLPDIKDNLGDGRFFNGVGHIDAPTIISYRREIHPFQSCIQRDGYQVITAFDGEEAVAKSFESYPDLIVLDIMLPKKNGYDVCKEIQQKLDTPIILLTAKTDIVDKVLGLELGADDYLTKPFDNRELLARIKAHLRRAKKITNADMQSAKIINGPLCIIPDERIVKLDDHEIHLTPKEFDLLLLLASHLEQVFPRDELLKEIWGYDYYGDTRTVDMHIQRIRRKIDIHPNKLIQTVFGIGYKMRKV